MLHVASNIDELERVEFVVVERVFDPRPHHFIATLFENKVKQFSRQLVVLESFLTWISWQGQALHNCFEYRLTEFGILLCLNGVVTMSQLY